MAEFDLYRENEAIILEKELNDYRSSMKIALGRKSSLNSKLRFLKKRRGEIGKLDPENNDYTVGYLKLEVLDELVIEINSRISSSGAMQMIGDESKRIRLGPERRRKTPHF